MNALGVQQACVVTALALCAGRFLFDARQPTPHGAPPWLSLAAAAGLIGLGEIVAFWRLS